MLSPWQWDDIIIAYRNGSPIRVQDVGQAVEGPESRLISAWQNGRRGVVPVVFTQPGANAVDAVSRIQAALPRLRASLPPAVQVQVVSDWTPTIRASVECVEITPGISFLVVFLFLRDWRAAVPPALVLVLVAVAGAPLPYHDPAERPAIR